MRRCRLTLLALLAGAACGCLAQPALAAAGVRVSIGLVEFAGLEIEDADVEWTPAGGANGRVGARAARIRGVAATGPLAAFEIDCPSLAVTGDTLVCRRGRLRGALGSLGSQDTRFDARAGADGRLAIDLDSVAVAGGRSKIRFTLADSRWQADATLDGVALDRVAAIAKPWMPLPDGFAVGGAATGKLRANGRSDALMRAVLDLSLAGLSFADAEGTLAGESIAAALRASLVADGRDFAVDAGHLEVTAGQAYSDPVFLDFGVHGAVVDFAGRLTGGGRFAAREFRIVHRDVLTASGSATVDFAGEVLLPEAKIRVENVTLAGAVPAYVQPFLIDTAMKDLEGAGSASGEIEIGGGSAARANFTLADIALDSPSGSISVTGLRGRLNWYSDDARTALAGSIVDAAFESAIAWDAARLWGIDFGAIELPFTTTGRHFRLLEPKLLPIFDGGVEIGTLRVRHAGTEQMYVRFDARIEPISMAPLARAFGWPEFQGTLAGNIPDLQFAKGVVTTGGNLEATVFDGRVVVRDLQLRDPLGKYPRLHASIDVDNLDLRLLTNTFSFGMITGRLSGRMEDLETFDWMPVSFDAEFGTPPGDRSKHRISQRAVTNLSSIGGGSGGGVAAALQGGLLRFFDDFGYDRLGLSCQLTNDVCTMDGVAPAANGYYIVKGKGLPRIDVIGSQKRVAWTRLVRQLSTIMESEIVVE
jgi:hypothetical protein